MCAAIAALAFPASTNAQALNPVNAVNSTQSASPLGAPPPAQPSSTLLDEQEQRRRAQQQQIERERVQSAPNVDLDNQPHRQTPDDGRLPPESPCFEVKRVDLQLPEGLSDTVRVAGLRALNADPLFRGALRFIATYLEQYQGQCVGREGLNLIVHRVSALVLERGYTTTRVLIPAQDLSSGTLHLTVVPGVIGSIRFADEHTWGTWRNAFPTHAGRLLNLRDLEQGLEQMKRVPNQDVDMKIVPGASTGQSDVVITVRREKPWTLSVSVDDSGLKSTGQLQATVHAGFSNLFGLSDILDVSYSHDVSGHESAYGTHGNSAFYAMPWGNWTFTAT
ncbi:MAG TPA: ShlB/FhaC/HecB family hemolysin secretion/activation protein, partial [Pararobbsia sp.]|nr:ShlB/FhaC/HecB family hemolysin secretion/activation protein [Pararobbsia sp.]